MTDPANRLVVAALITLAAISAAEGAQGHDAAACHEALTRALDYVSERRDGELPCSRAIESGRYSGVALAELYAKRGYIRQINWDANGALDDYGQAIQLNRRDHLTFYNRGVVRYHSGDYAGAVQDYTKAIAIAPDQPDYHHNRAFARLWQLDILAALADLWRAFVLAPFPQWLAQRLDLAS